MSSNLADIASVGNGPFVSTLIGLGNNEITFNTNSTQRLVVNTSGQIVVGSSTTANALLYVNGSSASPITTSSGTIGQITLDLSTSNNFTINLTGSAVLNTPINATAGQSGVIFLVQPSAGGASVTYGTGWKWSNGGVPTNTQTANAVDCVSYMVLTGGASPTMVTQFVANFM